MVAVARDLQWLGGAMRATVVLVAVVARRLVSGITSAALAGVIDPAVCRAIASTRIDTGTAVARCLRVVGVAVHLKVASHGAGVTVATRVEISWWPASHYHSC